MTTQDHELEKTELGRARYGCVFSYIFLLMIVVVMVLIFVLGIPPYLVLWGWPYIVFSGAEAPVGMSLKIHWLLAGLFVVLIPVFIFAGISRMIAKKAQ